MILILNYPFVDVRTLSDGPSRLDAPAWPSPIPGDSYVRYVGSVRLRPQRGIEGWIGEDKLCSARRAIRFVPPFPFHVPSGDGRKLPLRVVFRRLFFDGYVLGMYSLGIGTLGRATLSGRDLSDLIAGILQAEVIVGRDPSDENGPIPGPPGASHPGSRTTLVNAGGPLAKLYAAASTSLNEGGDLEPWLVRGFSPFPVLHLRKQPNRPAFPFDSIPPYEDAVTLHGVQANGKNLRLLVLDDRRLPGSTLEDRYRMGRRLRICFGRIYAESQALGYVLREIKRERLAPTPGGEASVNLGNYLRHATNVIRRKGKQLAELTEPAVAESARAMLEQAQPGEGASLERLLKDVEPRLAGFGLELRNSAVTVDSKTINYYIISVKGKGNVIAGSGPVYVDHGNPESPVVPEGSSPLNNGTSPPPTEVVLMELILQALIAGAAAAGKDTIGSAVKDAYGVFKALLKRKLGHSPSEDKTTVDRYEENPEGYAVPLQDEIKENGVDQDQEVLDQVQELLQRLEAEPQGDDIVTKAQQVVKQQIYGDNNYTSGTGNINIHQQPKS